MPKKGTTPERIIGLLRQAEVELAKGRTVGEVCRGLGVSEASFYRWRSEYGGLKVDQVRRMKELERENARLWSGRMPGWRGRWPNSRWISRSSRKLLRENIRPRASPGLCPSCARCARRFRTSGVLHSWSAALNAAPNTPHPGR